MPRGSSDAETREEKKRRTLALKPVPPQQATPTPGSHTASASLRGKATTAHMHPLYLITYHDMPFRARRWLVRRRMGMGGDISPPHRCGLAFHPLHSPLMSRRSPTAKNSALSPAIAAPTSYMRLSYQASDGVAPPATSITFWRKRTTALPLARAWHCAVLPFPSSKTAALRAPRRRAAPPGTLHARQTRHGGALRRATLLPLPSPAAPSTNSRSRSFILCNANCAKRHASHTPGT